MIDKLGICANVLHINNVNTSAITGNIIYSQAFILLLKNLLVGYLSVENVCSK